MPEREFRREYRRLSPEEKARYAEIARKVEEEYPPGKAKPGPPDPSLPAKLGDYFDLRYLVGELRKAREAQGLSLADIQKTTGIDCAALGRIESGEDLNPSINTLTRYAHAVGRSIELTLVAPETTAAEESERTREAG